MHLVAQGVTVGDGKHKKPVTCVMCGGKGYTEESRNGTVVKRACTRCNGTGRVT